MTERVGPKMSCFYEYSEKETSHETYIVRRPGVSEHKVSIACLFTCGEVNSVTAAVDSGLTFVLFTVLDLM